MAAMNDLRIRLIRVQPQSAHSLSNRRDSNTSSDGRNDADLVCCTTFSTTLASAPRYEALSYTWGDQKITAPIFLDSRVTEVTVNLEAALRHISTTRSETMTIWIDAICINQMDEKEKTEQVGRMRDIYSQATHVIAWLGRSEDPNRTRIALEWMSRWAERAKCVKIGSTPDMFLRKVLDRSVGSRSKHDDDKNNININNAESAFTADLKKELSGNSNQQYKFLMASLQEFLDRPYWSRIWVIQEVKMAKSVNFVCPEGTIEPRALDAALRILRNFRYWQLQKYGSDILGYSLEPSIANEVLPTDPSNALNLLGIKKTRSYAIPGLLQRTQQCNATDPRDRIFALLGLSKNAGRLRLQPNYSLTCEQVYTELAREVLQRGNLELLENCTLRVSNSNVTRLSLQSWVPDWTASSMHSRLQQRGYIGPKGTKNRFKTLRPDFRASGDRRQEWLETVHWNDPLFLSIISIAEVSSVASPASHGDLGCWLDSVQKLVDAPECRYSHHPTEKSSAIWRTAVADQDVPIWRDRPRLSDEAVERLQTSFSGMPLCSSTARSFVDVGMGNYAEVINTISRGRRPFLLSNGHVGIGPQGLIPGDHVMVVLGAGVPYVLRSQADSSYVIVGSAYVHGYMDGEAADEDAFVQKIEIR